MSQNIYQINSWAASTTLSRNDIVTNANLFYYAVRNFTTSSSIATDISNGNLVGYLTDNNESKPYFTWIPAYGHSTDSEPKVKKIKFGEGYGQNLADGINNNLPMIYK